MARTIDYELFFDWNRNGTFTSGENEANYMLSASGDESIANPDESAFASTGYTTDVDFVMINKGQRYSPSNTTGPYYTNMSGGGFYQIPVRLNVILNGTSYTLFTGVIKSINENPRSEKDAGLVNIHCTSEDGALINRKLETSVNTTSSFHVEGKDEGRLIAQTLTLAGLTDGTHFISQDYAGTPGVDIPTIAPGMFTIPWYWLDSESPIDDCWKLAAACGGRFFYDVRTKMYTYHNMSMYSTVATSKTSQATIDESNALIKPLYNDKELYSKVKVTSRPRTIGFTQELWKSEDIPRLAPGETITLWAKVNNPVYEYKGYTFEATTTSGLSRTGDIYVAPPSYYTQAVKFTITNTGVYHVFLRNFKLTGKPIEGGENYVYEKSSPNTSYWSNKNGKERAIDNNPYIQTPAQAQALGDMLAGRQGNYAERYNVRDYRGATVLRAGNRITISSSTLGISSREAIVTKAQFNLADGQFTQDFECFAAAYLQPLPNTDYFLIGTNSSASAKKYFY